MGNCADASAERNQRKRSNMKSANLMCRVVRCCRTGAVVGLLGGLGAGLAQAEGFRNPPEGAASMGSVGGNIVMDDDASAVSRNPANLVLLPDAEVQAGANIIHAKVKFTSALSGQTDETQDPWKFLPYAFASMPLNNNWALGVGVDVPFGQSVIWSQEGQFRYTAPYYSELTVVNINPTLATKLGDHLCIGVGVDIYDSDLDLRQIVPWSQATGAPVPDGEEELKGSGTGIGGNAALTWLINSDQQMALTYRSPVKVNYDGHLTADNIPVMMQAMVLPRADFNTEITFPASATLGYSIKPCDKLKLEADVEWIQFSRYSNLTLDADGDNPLLHPAGDPTPPSAPLTIPQNWKDSWTAGVGAEYQLTTAWALRAGYEFIQSPIPNNTLAPTLPDGNRSVVSVGLGYKCGAHAVDLAFMQSFYPNRTISTQSTPYYNGTYTFNSQIIACSYTFSF
jgi:long-chain fatty acid transport protein